MDWRDLDEDCFFERSVRRLEQCAAAGAISMKIWKDLGLRLHDRDGSFLRIDDSRLDPLFARAAELGIFIMFHTADPAAFFLPTDERNERHEELSAHPDWSFYGSAFSREELLAHRNRVFRRHPATRFVAAHMGEQPEDLAALAAMLDAHSNGSTRYVGARGRTRPPAVHSTALLPAIRRSHPLWRGPAAGGIDVSRALSVL
jgi:predicted TIM-barrel fold metal-dependent hydrolase